MDKSKKYGFETLMIHAGYDGDEKTHSVAPPIYQTNAYYYDSTEHARKLFELSEAGNIYTRLQNPTNDILEGKITALEGGFAALAFSSGHAAIFNTVVNLCESGDEIVSSINIYGGAINLLGVTLRRLGINVTFVDINDFEAWENAITEKTKLLFTEAIGNPNANVSDIENLSKIAKKYNIPLMVDGTFTTPYLCKPIEWGADLVVHSATKYLSGHGQVMAGIVVDSGNFIFKDNERFPLYNKPDLSYHGLVFADLGKAAFMTRLRALVMRDIGACLAPFNAYNTFNGMMTLSIRMERHCENALKVARFLESHSEIEKVNYPMLESSPDYELAKKYLPKGASGVFTFVIKGDRARAARFIDGLQLIQNVANVGDIRTQVVHPATTTHSQLTNEQLAQSGISEGTIRITVGLESVDDIINDIREAINK